MCKIAEGIMLAFLIGCSVSDWRRKAIPLWLLVLFSIATLSLCILCQNSSIGQRAGGVALGLVFFAISKCTKEALGYGDSWMILLLGIWLGGTRLLQLLFAASLISGMASLFLLWRRGWKRKETIPFVPFLALAYVLGGMVT